MDTNNLIVTDKAHLRLLLTQNGKPHYTYILRKPDGVVSHGGVGTPFYVGIGQGSRLFAHIEAASDPSTAGRKVDSIREIWGAGGQVIHCIDAFHLNDPWDREEELIRTIGQLKHGTGPLTNEQDYAPSTKLNGIELRKYAKDHLESADNIPVKFKLGGVRLAAGPNEPKSRQSVFGKIYSVLEEHPGVTGTQLVALLKRIDFSGNKSAYTQSGEVCAAWICGYIEGGFFRSDRRHIQHYSEATEGNCEGVK